MNLTKMVPTIKNSMDGTIFVFYRLVLSQPHSGQILAEHDLCLDRKGQLIRNRSHLRDRTKGVPEYMKHVAAQFTDTDAAESYIEEIRVRKPRYMRDQLQVIDQSLKNYGASAAEQALAYCVKHRLYRATDFADAAQHFSHQEQQEADESTLNVESLVQVDKEKYTAKPQIREFQTYERILGGG